MVTQIPERQVSPTGQLLSVKHWEVQVPELQVKLDGQSEFILHWGRQLPFGPHVHPVGHWYEDKHFSMQNPWEQNFPEGQSLLEEHAIEVSVLLVALFALIQILTIIATIKIIIKITIIIINPRIKLLLFPSIFNI